jgi:hypothetical protein
MAEDRLTVLCEQLQVTGIDFIEVVEPHVQTWLRVYFVVDPDTLAVPMVATAAIPAPFPIARISIVSPTGGKAVTVTAATWESVITSTGPRTVLDIRVAEPGDFSFYRLTIDDAPANRVDRFFNGVLFSFKQGCPSVFDCRRHRQCLPEEDVDWPVDYLARDFESIRNALLDFSAQRYPLWRERIPADMAVMLMELAAALGDEFSYIQDRIAREASLETLAERRSLRWHTRLVDYPLDDGASATTWLDIQMMAGLQQNVALGTRVWATPAGEPAIPFEIGRGLRDQRVGAPIWLSAAWNAIPVHVPDEGNRCLLAGTTELYIVGHFPLAAHLPVGAIPARAWLDRPVLIRADAADPSIPSRRHLVHVTAIEQTSDPLILTAGLPTPITRLVWAADEALPFDLCLSDAEVHVNIVPATAGETFADRFVIKNTANVPAADLPVGFAIERQGPLNEFTLERPPIYLYSLIETETRGLGMLGGVPEVELEELQPDPGMWEWRSSLIEARGGSENFTLDDGTWRTVITFDRPGGRIEHRDRASGRGATIRFGDGEFGRIPPDDTYFRVLYRTDVGARGNLPADSVNVLRDPVPRPPGFPPWPTLAAFAFSATNPFPILDGRDPDDLDTVKQMAPEAFKANPRRAVRDEDYRAIAERLAWVQRAGATARWTGSWLTEFVTADPRGGTELTEPLRASLEREMNCVRQAGRPVVVRDPVFLPIDLRIVICVRPEAFEGQVLERLTEMLTGPRRPGRAPAFFDPDNFTFGTPLNRSSLEAAVQADPGVLGVEEIQLRVRGLFDWRVFNDFVFRPGDDRIIRIDNDPNRPERGSLIVTARSLVP